VEPLIETNTMSCSIKNFPGIVVKTTIDLYW
jgi:hypothetical protein